MSIRDPKYSFIFPFAVFKEDVDSDKHVPTNFYTLTLYFYLDNYLASVDSWSTYGPHQIRRYRSVCSALPGSPAAPFRLGLPLLRCYFKLLLLTPAECSRRYSDTTVCDDTSHGESRR